MNDDAVVIAIGSNLAGGFESSKALLDAALEAFGTEGLRIFRTSSWWRSAAWPDATLPDYLNGVVLVESTQSPLAVLGALHRLENRFGRVRGQPNASRTLDLDLIAHGRTVMAHADLVLPHPRAAGRRFVMGPLAEIAPDWLHPVLGVTAETLLASASVGLDARPLDG